MTLISLEGYYSQEIGVVGVACNLIMVFLLAAICTMGLKLTKCLLQFFLVWATFHESASKASSDDGTTATRVFSPKSLGSLRTAQDIFIFLHSKQSRAILSHDPVGNLPTAFTICSTVMVPFMFQDDEILFLTMLDKNGNGLFDVFMRVFMTNEGIDTMFNSAQHWKELEKDGKELKAFSQRWIKWCAALNRSSGLGQHVVDGVFVWNGTVPESFLANIPTDLSGKIVLGGRKFRGHWVPSKNKVTNLNIFSTAHSVEVMRQNTVGGGTVGKSVFVSGIPFFKAEFS